jgi:hypothetical protein
MKKLLLILLYIFSLQAAFAFSVDLSQNFNGAELGQGLQTSTSTLTPFPCVEIENRNVQQSANFIVKSDYLEIETIDELKKLTKSSFALSELFKSKMENSLTSSKESKVLKITLSFLQKQNGRTTFKLNPNFESLARNGLFVEFANNCGNEFISSIAYGHKMHLFMIMNSESEESTKELEAALKLNLTEILSKISGAEPLEQILGKLEITTSILQKLQQLSRKVQIEYSIAMSGSSGLNGESSERKSEKPTANIQEPFSDTGTDLTQMMLVLTKQFPKFALNEMKNNSENLPQIEGNSETYGTLLSNSFFAKKIAELEKDELNLFLRSNQDFNFFITSFKKLEERYSQIDLLLSKAQQLARNDQIKFLRNKAFKEILKFLEINKQSMENIQSYCSSSSLVYAECFAMAFGKSPKDKPVGEAFIQAGINFSCIEANDFSTIKTCLDKGMDPLSCRTVNFSQFNNEKKVCEKVKTNILEDSILPIQPENL